MAGEKSTSYLRTLAFLLAAVLKLVELCVVENERFDI